MEAQAKEAMILNLFDAYPSSGQQVSQSRIATYLDAVERYPVEAVRRSVEQFVTGKVERDNRSFVPSADEFSSNVAKWDTALIQSRNNGPELHNGLIEMDFGAGRIDMRGLTNAEQDKIIANKGCAPNGMPLAYLSLGEIRAAISPERIATEPSKEITVPKMRRIE